MFVLYKLPLVMDDGIVHVQTDEVGEVGEGDTRVTNAWCQITVQIHCLIVDKIFLIWNIGFGFGANCDFLWDNGWGYI